MSGSIFLVGEDGGLTELREQPYEAEPALQELLARDSGHGNLPLDGHGPPL